MQEVVSHYGVINYHATVSALLDYAEKLMRAGISELQNGVYCFEDFMDDDGITKGKPVPIRASIQINDNSALVDFEGTSPQVDGPINVPLNGTLATVFYCFKALVGANIPSNEGIYRALQVKAPQGCILNCQAPAAVGERIDTCQRVADVIFGAMAQAAPERVITASNSSVTTATFSGTNPQSGNFFVYLETIAGGQGAHSSGDGLSGVQVHMTNTSNLPIEALEREYPLLVERYQLRIDSGGAGLFRGGLGIQRDIRTLVDGITFSSLADRQSLSPWGLQGGLDGSAGEYLLIRENEKTKKLGSKQSDVLLKKGDVISIRTPGSGGFGDPLQRCPQEVAEDFLEGKVSKEAAKKLYKVVLTSQGEVDDLKTKSLRK